MEHKQNANVPSCLRYTFVQSGYKASYNQCGKPSHRKGRREDPLAIVQHSLPQAFDQEYWRRAAQKSPPGLTTLQKLAPRAHVCGRQAQPAG